MLSLVRFRCRKEVKWAIEYAESGYWVPWVSKHELGGWDSFRTQDVYTL